jgi:hypothetical protein
MKAYIAAAYDQRFELRPIVTRLEEAGLIITSRWIWKEIPYTNDDETMKKAAVEDLYDLWLADILIIDTTVPSTTGGKYVELGYALATKDTILGVGQRTNPFTYLFSKWYPSWKELIAEAESVEGLRLPVEKSPSLSRRVSPMLADRA